jgi:hypothetical protein
MISFLRPRNLALFVLAFGTLTLFGFAGPVGQQAGQDDGAALSGPPQLNATYQAREPRLCKALLTPPSPWQARVLVQCTMEADRPTGLFLMQNVRVEIGAPRSYEPAIDSNLAEIDMTAPIVPLVGSLTVYWCSPPSALTPAGSGCTVSPTPVAAGKCWRTKFGDWKCNLLGPAPDSRSGLPGPMTY